jgi:hypothetical protein
MMDDLISRQAAIDEVNRLAKFFWEKWHEYAPSTIAVTDALKEIPSAQQWIPAHNIFPGENGKYLVTGKHGAVNIIKYEDGRWYGGMSPIAWMPLPKPYREEDNSEL